MDQTLTMYCGTAKERSVEALNAPWMRTRRDSIMWAVFHAIQDLVIAADFQVAEYTGFSEEQVRKRRVDLLNKNYVCLARDAAGEPLMTVNHTTGCRVACWSLDAAGQKLSSGPGALNACLNEKREVEKDGTNRSVVSV